MPSAGWNAMRVDLARLHPGAQQIWVDSGRAMPTEEPAAIRNAIQAVLGRSAILAAWRQPGTRGDGAARCGLRNPWRRRRPPAPETVLLVRSLLSSGAGAPAMAH